MPELANYSIETDQLILLSFEGGQSLRVTVGQLPKHLSPRDLKRVRRAIKLRRDFFRDHMPGALAILAVLAVMLTALAVTSGQMLALLWHRQLEAPDSAAQTEIVRNVLPDFPAVSPTPSTSPAMPRLAAGAQAIPGNRSGSGVRSSKTSADTPAPAANPVSSLTPVLPAAAPGAPTPIPSPPPASPDQPSTDSVANGPIPAGGQVLGDSTGPNDPAPAPTPAPAS